MQKSNVTIRYAVENDAPGIASIHVKSWQKIYRDHISDDILNNLSIEMRTQAWRDLIVKGIKIALLENEKQIIGFASLGPSRDADKPADQYGEISSIYLHPDFWHQGLGKLLCSFALDELKRRGYSKVILWVLKNNKQARQFYESMGFILNGNEKIDTIHACKLGAIIDEVATENVNVPFHEICYSRAI